MGAALLQDWGEARSRFSMLVLSGTSRSGTRDRHRPTRTCSCDSARVLMPETRDRRFTTTRWSLILAAADPRSSSAHEALSSLCEIYWMPVYAFVRRTGASVEDARDLTQAFFTKVLEKGYFQDAQPERGRFRTFLLTAVA